MSNKIFESILDEKISFFKFTFEQTANNVFIEDGGKLIHPGEYGTYRENACKDFLRMIVPNKLEIGSGFLLNSKGSYSSQCDIVVYDRNSTPLIENLERQRFYPIETIAAVGEIKSNVSKKKLVIALNKLAKFKKLREELSNPVIIRRDNPGIYNPKKYPYDNIFTFLICNKFNFKWKNIENEIDSYYEPDILPRHKHNLILSINDGLLAYHDDVYTMMYPFLEKKFNNRMILPVENNYSHFYYASSYLFMGTSSNTILYPDLSEYLGAPKEFIRDQKF